MKKTLAFLLALLLTFTMLPVSAFAAENPTFTVSSATGKAGDEVTVVVEIENNPGIWAYNYGIEYDTTRLEKVSYTGGGMDGGTWTIDQKVLWESSTFDNSTYNGETVVLKFKIKDDAPAGDAEIKIKDDFFACNCDGNIVNADIVAGKVTVEGKLETVIPLTKDNHDANSENIKADKYSNVGGLKIEGVKIVDWTQWKQGGNYQTQSITIYVAPESKDDIATLSLVLLNGQTGRGPLIDNPATVDVQLNNGAGSYSNNYTFIGTNALAPKLNLVITFELAKEECEHQWKDATCTEPKTCELCFATEGEALGHSYEAVVTEPTCTEGGYTTYTCAACGDSYVADEVPALGHDYEYETVKEPTCTEEGKRRITCKNGCGYEAEETIEALGHDEVVDEAVAPTCTETGLTEGEHCSVCGEVLVAQEVVEALGHSYEAVVTEPTCTEGGYTTYTCAACGDSYVADEVPALGHDYEYKIVKKPTCTEEGKREITCANGCDYKAEESIEALGHEWDEWEVVKEASYTEEGSKKRVCENDESHVETETIEKLVPTATEKGDGYDVAYQEGVVIVPEDSNVTVQDIKDALTDKVEKGSLKGEVVVTFMEATIGYIDNNNNFVPIDSNEYFKDGKTIDITLPYPKDGDADKNDNFEVYHYLDDGRIDKCVIKEKNDKGLVIEVGHLSPFVIAYQGVSNVPSKPSKPVKPSDKDVITIVIPEEKAEESNPNTGAPVLYSFDLTAAGVVVLAATAAVLEIKRRK